jgi:hypothetical protein
MTGDYDPVIADFGLVGAAKRVKGFGTRIYAAPEVFSETNAFNILNY